MMKTLSTVRPTRQADAAPHEHDGAGVRHHDAGPGRVQRDRRPVVLGAPSRIAERRRGRCVGGRHLDRLTRIERMMARRQRTLEPLDEQRLLLRTDLLRTPAPGAEPAAARRVDRRRHVTLEHDAVALRSRLGDGHRHSRQQGGVYGCVGFWYRSRRLAISTILPRYITATRSETWRTTDRSWAMNR